MTTLISTNFRGTAPSDYSADAALRPNVGQFIEIVRLGNGLLTGNDAIKIAKLTLSTASGDQTITIGGVPIVVPYTTSDTATAAAIAAAINGTYSPSSGGSFPPEGGAIAARVVATSAAGVITISGRFPGDDFPITYAGTGGTLLQDGTGGTQLASLGSDVEFGLAAGVAAGEAALGGLSPVIIPGAAAEFKGIFGTTGVQGSEEYSPNGIPSFKLGRACQYLSLGKAIAQVVPGVTIASDDAAYLVVSGSEKLGSFSNTNLGGDAVLIAGATFCSANYQKNGLNLAALNIE